MVPLQELNRLTLLKHAHLYHLSMMKQGFVSIRSENENGIVFHMIMEQKHTESSI
jgi:hypothetical protein